MRVIERPTWLIARNNHVQITESWVADRLRRRSLAQKHPVDDFMFEYYPISPKKLQTWHPGIEHTLTVNESDKSYFDDNQYVTNDNQLSVSRAWLLDQIDDIHETLELLKATMNRTASHGCFGLHEWAMVLGAQEIRHEQWRLRLSDEQIRQTIQEVGLKCTHFDAFRFFTEEARPLNPLQLARKNQIQFEQPGCLHANMDLYKIAHRWSAIVGSPLVRMCFRLAREIRTLDMQSAPYDLENLGVMPIKLETSQGRAEFAKLQKQFSQRAQLLRENLIMRLERATLHEQQISLIL